MQMQNMHHENLIACEGHSFSKAWKLTDPRQVAKGSYEIVCSLWKKCQKVFNHVDMSWLHFCNHTKHTQHLWPLRSFLLPAWRIFCFLRGFFSDASHCHWFYVSTARPLGICTQRRLGCEAPHKGPIDKHHPERKEQKELNNIQLLCWALTFLRFVKLLSAMPSNQKASFGFGSWQRSKAKGRRRWMRNGPGLWTKGKRDWRVFLSIEDEESKDWRIWVFEALAQLLNLVSLWISFLCLVFESLSKI